jgi:hypothetical protein
LAGLAASTDEIVVESCETRTVREISSATSGGVASEATAGGGAGETKVETRQTELIAAVVVILIRADTCGSGYYSMLGSVAGETTGITSG